MPLKIIAALNTQLLPSRCGGENTKLRILRQVRRNPWELRKEEGWLSANAKLLENLPKLSAETILGLYLKAISKYPSA